MSNVGSKQAPVAGSSAFSTDQKQPKPALVSILNIWRTVRRSGCEQGIQKPILVDFEFNDGDLLARDGHAAPWSPTSNEGQ